MESSNEYVSISPHPLVKRYQTDAIILQTHPSRERDKLVVFLTPERGKLRAWAYGSRSLKNRFGAALEPLSKVHLHYAIKENDEVARIEAIELIRSMFRAQQRLADSVALSYLAELADTFAQPEDPSDLLYRLLDHACDALAKNSPPALVVAYAEVWMLKIAGLLPSVHSCLECSRTLELPLRYEATRGGFVCERCSLSAAELLPNEVSRVLGSVLRQSIEDVVDSAPDEAATFEMRMFAARLRREFLGHELRSWELLQSVL